MIRLLLALLRPPPSHLTPAIWQAREEWMTRAASEAMESQLAEIRALDEQRF